MGEISLDGLSDETIEEEIERLRVEHQALEHRLDELNGNVYLTPDEQVEEARIKKIKLQKKDRIRSLEKQLHS